MSLAALFVAVVVAGVSAVNAGIPAAAWARARDGRFLILSLAHLVLAVVGGIWAWGQLPLSPPVWASAPLPVMGLLLAAVLLFLATGLWPRRR